MIYFITNRQHQVEEQGDLYVLNYVTGVTKFYEYLTSKFYEHVNNLVGPRAIESAPEIGFDIEASGLDPLTSTPLLYIFGDKDVRFVFDATCEESTAVLENVARLNIRLVGHNLKYDYTVVKAQTKVALRNLWDVMVCEQFMTKNTGYTYSLVAIVERRLKLSNVFDKNTRTSFIGMTKKSIFTTNHILYAENDVKYLLPLKDAIREKLVRYNMTWFAEEIENNLVWVLGDAELRGFEINEEKWKENIKNAEDLKYQTELNLDDLIRSERDKLPAEERIHLVGGKFDRPRIRQIPEVQYDLFGNVIPFEATYQKANKGKSFKKFTPNKGNISYSSSLLTILARLKYRVPTKEGTWSIPTIGTDQKANGYDKNYVAYSTQKNEIEAFLLANPDCSEEKFYNYLKTFRKASKKISTYGESFLAKKSPVTNRIHTIFRQCFADNGRLQSGGGKSQPDKINGQNIPAEKEYRECFHSGKDRYVVTSDLSGAEVVIMADKANDKRLLELNNVDIHSHMAQTGWRNIYLYRAGVIAGKWNNPNLFFKLYKSEKIYQDLLSHPNVTIQDLARKSRAFVVSKQINEKSHRKPCKNLTFGGVYGCKAKKAGKTLNISPDEGSIYLGTLRREIPSTFQMVEANVDFAYNNGYLVLNSRSNSRVWFLNVLQELIQNPKNAVDRHEYYEVDGQARNMPISGTQADMVKEAMVEIAKRIVKENWDAHLLMQVHDELVYDYPKTMSEVKFVSDRGQVQTVSFGEYVALTMIEVSNRYLKNMKMHADFQIKDTWTK